MTAPDTHEKKSKSFHLPRWAWWVLGASGLVIITSGGLAAMAYATQQRTVVKNTYVAGTNLGGLDSLTALTRVEDAWAAFTKRGWQFTTPANSTITVPIIGGGDSAEGGVVELVVFPAPAAGAEAYAFGHRGSFWQQLRERTSGWLGRRHNFGAIVVDSPALEMALKKQVGQHDVAAKNAGIAIDEKGAVTVTPSAAGKTIDYPAALAAAIRQARTFGQGAIALRVVDSLPSISSSAALQPLAARDVPVILARAPLTIKADDRTWTIEKKELGTLLGFVKTGTTVSVGFDAAALRTYFVSLAKDFDVAAANARFSVVNGKVQEFGTAVTGKAININGAMRAMADQVITAKQSTVTLLVEVTKPESETLGQNSFGIAELVGEGSTNFAGSPANRRYNLTLGASRLNGLLIKPGQEFSLVKALGAIDAAHGWKSELVIKGTDIKPEYGGGLCQVATTFFRAILNAGLPVTERHNHSLRISYYEPPVGLDATIYEPSPDLRFQNDYTHYLLLQTSVVGNVMTFQFYGTKDGRVSSVPTPKVYNRTPIPPTKTVETTELKPGEKKCQAPGHPGADATATYTVTYADGRQNKQVFQSHYRAIPIICQVGVKPKPVVKKPKTTTNTNAAANTNATVNTNAAVDTNTAVPATDANTNL